MGAQLLVLPFLLVFVLDLAAAGEVNLLRQSIAGAPVWPFLPFICAHIGHWRVPVLPFLLVFVLDLAAAGEVNLLRQSIAGAPMWPFLPFICAHIGHWRVRIISIFLFFFPHVHLLAPLPVYR